MDPFVECSQIPEDYEAEQSIKEDYNEYIGQLVNTTPHDIHIQIGHEMYVIPTNKENILRASTFYQEINIGAPYKTYSTPKYLINTMEVKAILDKRIGKKTILIVSTILANAFETHKKGDEEELSLFDSYDFEIQVPNTNPEEVVRDENGVIKAVKSMIHYKF